jgi:acyl carrier protein
MTIPIETVEQALGAHIHEEILLRNTPLARDADLFDAGFDSLSLSRVLVFIEARFGIMIPDEEVVLDEVSTLEKMARFVHDRLERAGR